jgi:hypothetical protein
VGLGFYTNNNKKEKERLMKKTKKVKEGARKILKKKKTNENGINWPDLRELKKKKITIAIVSII